MAIKTLQFIEVDSDPLDHLSDLRPEYVEMADNFPQFADALAEILDMPEEATCDNCKGIVGYYLEETDDGRLEHAYWHYTALILHGVGYPVVVLCEDCAAPVIQPSHAWVADQRGVLSTLGMTSLVIAEPDERWRM